jgi:exosortase
VPGIRPTRFELTVVALLLVVQAPGLLRLAEVWSEVEYASHGFLVPLVAIWAATAHRDQLARLAAAPASGGFVLLGLVSLLSLAALLIDNPSLIGVGLVASVWVAVLALRGRAWVETLVFPLSYLLFMIPLPLSWVAPLIVQLQLFVSSLAVGLLRATGIAIFKEGNVLTLPGDISLFVAEACSGITSLITLLPIGVFVAYFTEFELRRRLVIVLAVVPIALAGNLLRVILTVFLAMHVDLEYATQGPLHEWAGVATYVIGCLCLLAVGRVMRALWPEPSPQPA